MVRVILTREALKTNLCKVCKNFMVLIRVMYLQGLRSAAYVCTMHQKAGAVRDA